MRDAGIELIDFEGDVGAAFAVSGFETAWERLAALPYIGSAMIVTMMIVIWPALALFLPGLIR